jgi:hypothetical protein
MDALLIDGPFFHQSTQVAFPAPARATIWAIPSAAADLHARTVERNVTGDERSVPTTIEFEGLSLRPARYANRSDDDGTAINFQATLTPAETERIRALQLDRGAFWPVSVDGSAALTMRLGSVYWQGREDSDIDHAITLVGEDWDANSALFPFLGGEPRVGRLMRAVANLTAQVEVLRDAADPQIAELARRTGAEAGRTGLYVFNEVEDLSRLWTAMEG